MFTIEHTKLITSHFIHPYSAVVTQYVAVGACALDVSRSEFSSVQCRPMKLSHCRVGYYCLTFDTWRHSIHSLTHSPTVMMQTSGFLPICQNQTQGLFKDFQGPHKGYIRRTKLNQRGTFISIYMHIQFTFDNLTPASINQKLELSEKFTKCINSCH